ncbi:MAG: HAMP domain-containing histidine kinase [Candidatus Scalindua rubra]|uniref:histidine kinase n=1 Tax=Candidatus Scalindua brodae TaxID=237368 RepID=A0A0B0EME0_9BACT|nr:MAG: two-component sensor kinase [Candidatus Scalindua brodae]MBZ0108667.1 HAMP domain-containing histidine kinase [Candidatus Scalindua rubra]TWU37969.1 Alkaline phosphatase synthesis sensor protein PhoR [Candidatus Brocadiaceae bacterium S225]
MKLFQGLIIFVFLGTLYLTWHSFDQMNDQQTRNHAWLLGQARNLNNKLIEQLDDWKNELAKKTPANVGQCLAMKEVAVSQESPLWPISPFTGLDNTPYWINNGEFDKEKIGEFESALYHDRYLILRWLKLKGESDYNVNNIDVLLDWARRGEKIGKAFIDLSGRVYVHPLLIVLPGGNLIRGWRANVISEELLAYDNEYVRLSVDKTSDDLLNHQFLGTNFNWSLTPEGSEFLYQAKGVRGLVLSAVLTIGVFVYAIFFFYRNQVVLARQSALREQMVSDISHELRTPVTTIRLYAEMLRDGRVREKEKQQLYYNRVVNESLRLERLIENVLDFSRIGQHRLKLELKSIKLGTLQHKLEELIDFLDENNRVVFNWQKGNIVSADMEAAIQVFYNLISNALKYSESGSIELSSRCTDDRVVITILDHGEGIPAEETNNLFESFYRGGKAHQRQIHGSGLGLGIARGLMEAMSGRLDFVGNCPGACFEVMFIRSSREIEA